MPILLGNAFPLSLIRRPALIEPRTLDELRREVAAHEMVSFWGHDNTLDAVRAVLGFDPTPATARPALTLDGNSLPALDGVAFDEVWILSPDYADGFRPEIGVEVPLARISGWQVLRISF